MDIKIRHLPEIIASVYDNPSLRKKIVPMFISNPGMGKTTIINSFAKERGVKLLTEILSTKMPHELTAVAVPDYNKSTLTYFDYDKFLELKDGDIILLDDALNCEKSTLDALLNFLLERELPTGKKIANVAIFAAANPQAMLNLTPQQKQRFVFYNLVFDKDFFETYMMQKYLMPNNIVEHISKLVENEIFLKSNFNYWSCRSADIAVEMSIAGLYNYYTEKLKGILNFRIPTKEYGEIAWIDLYKLYLKELQHENISK